MKVIDNLPLELTPPKKKGEAERVNRTSSTAHNTGMRCSHPCLNSSIADRISVTSVEFADALFQTLAPHLPAFPYPASVRKPANNHSPHSLNSNIRMYKYTPGQHFGCHYDDSVRDPNTGAKSEWTLLVYLSGVQDGVKGGEVRLLKPEAVR